MATLIDLYLTRQAIGKIRQSRHSKALDELDTAMKPVNSPYDDSQIDRDFYDRLTTVKDRFGNLVFFDGSMGYPVSVRDDADERSYVYIYRLTSAYKLAKELKFYGNWNLSTINMSDEIIFDAEFFEYINLRFSGWIDFTVLGKNTLKYRRNFSFWTDHEININNTRQDIFQLGLTSDWFGDRGLILRCRIHDSTVTKFHVPTVIDAFDQPIFYPTSDVSGPECGRAIHIDTDPFELGKNEFAVGEIDVETLEFIPVELSGNKINFEGNTVLWDKLDLYYQTL